MSKLPTTALVQSTVATRHYGVNGRGVFNEMLDYGEKKVFDRDGIPRCNTFTWYIKTGDTLLRDQAIRFPFARSVDVDYVSDDLIFVDTLYDSRDRYAPRHKSKGHSITVNCSMKSDFRGVDRSRFRRKLDPQGEL